MIVPYDLLYNISRRKERKVGRCMIKWQDVTEGTKELEGVLEEVSIILTPHQFVVLNEVIQDYTGSKGCDGRIYEVLKNLKFEFKKRSDESPH